MRFISAVLAALLGFALIGPTASAAPQVNRAEMLQRAASWLTANNGGRVPYSMTKNWSDGYRQDCSGFVSMSAKLGGPGPNTVALATNTWTVPVKIADLKPGDLFIDPVDEPGDDFRHVVIFEKWTKPNAEYLAYEQRGGFGTDHRTRTYGLEPNSKYHPYRLKNIVD
ncbi:hypothetical protein Lesp02_81920 [Lentzea sp. NBRC 105346]|uniref:hypothetical protein n=1 Tax=Lentzea sp. NBRC 105346 TaxID=3032205 RepID=UPI0024A12046|nr:hypothetical protein [Lentzea sp. NBRC 105346]GLZ36005.1 hypothetical protein Lesp02_81920 [Lentzea sp. NBRC 105346]